jgi:hypothetical protein
MTRSWRRSVWVAAGLCWLGVVAAGMAMVMEYDTTPGAPAEAPRVWPKDSHVALAADRPTLIMFAHPRCDCTRASLSELAELLARATHRPRSYVVFIKPAQTGEAWEQTAVWKQASSIPGIEILRDDNGDEANRFGVQTSGQAMMFLPDTRLAFSGGTTSARGKTGLSIGRTTLLDLLDGRPASTFTAPVYGCPLFGPADAAEPAGEHPHVG